MVFTIQDKSHLVNLDLRIRTGLMKAPDFQFFMSNI